MYLCWLVSIAVPPEDLTLCTGCVYVRFSTHWSQTSVLVHRKWSVVKKINRMKETRKDFPAHYCTFHKEKETNKTQTSQIFGGFTFSTPCLNWENLLKTSINNYKSFRIIFNHITLYAGKYLISKYIFGTESLWWLWKCSRSARLNVYLYAI